MKLIINNQKLTSIHY